MEIRLDGKIALVTGASSGFGRHFAMRLAEEGADVALAARRIDRLESRASEITKKTGRRCLPVAMDVADSASVKAAFEAVGKGLGAADILVNNAGTVVSKPAMDTTEEDWDGVVDTNLKGAFLVAQAFARALKEEGRPGAVVNIASILGIGTSEGVVGYNVSKAGVIQLTRTLAREWARYGIRVNAIAPGYVATDLNRDFLESEAGEAMKRRIPQRRFGEIGDLDGALMLLASDKSSWMTGSTLTLDGGHTLVMP